MKKAFKQRFPQNLLRSEGWQTLFHTESFTEIFFLDTDAFTHRNFYTQELLHRNFFHANTSLHKMFYTKAFYMRTFLLLDTGLLQRNFHTQNLYAETLLRTESFTQKLLHGSV